LLHLQGVIPFAEAAHVRPLVNGFTGTLVKRQGAFTAEKTRAWLLAAVNPDYLKNTRRPESRKRLPDEV
jgi:hypothetical protein